MERAKAIEDVNAQLPAVQKIFERILELNEASAAVTKDIQALLGIWGRQLHEEGNPDHGFYQEKMMKKKDISHELHHEVARVRELGGIVKDVRRGLVDFYFEPEGSEGVYLCWKLGEEKVSHWHPVRGGAGSRRPITELLQARQV